MRRTEVERLFEDYRFYWLQTGNVQRLRESGKYVRTHKLTEERYALFSDLYDWCVERDVDPRLWLFVLFRIRRWMFAPQLKRGHLLSEKILRSGRYLEVVESGCLDGYRLHKLGQVEGLDPNRDLIPGAEQKKRVYARSGQASVCMLVMPAETFGFHPQSRWCCECPVAEECRARLDRLVSFDVQALREGRITVEQARAAACHR